jgi:hypothetical protein
MLLLLYFAAVLCWNAIEIEYAAAAILCWNAIEIYNLPNIYDDDAAAVLC